MVAAKLRIYKLPQNLTSSLPSTSGSSVVDEQEEEDEKKIRISVYYYTKTLRKHRGEVTGHMIIFSFCYVSFTLFLFSCRIEKKNSPFVQPPPHHHQPPPPHAKEGFDEPQPSEFIFLAKKRLMDSLVTPLTNEGTHLALDVRQGLRFWRLNPRNPHGNGGNHGLVIQVEDQDGRPLKPALYIQEPSCSNGDDDQKACECVT